MRKCRIFSLLKLKEFSFIKDRLTQRPVTMPSVASLYSSLNTDMKGDTVDIIIVHTLVCILHR